MLSTPLRFLALSLKELSLATVLKSGQSFRWQKFPTINVCRPDTNASGSNAVTALPEDGEEWAIGYQDRTIVLRQTPEGIHYRSLYPLAQPTAFLHDLESNTTLPILRRYFQLDVLLEPLYAGWAAKDKNFKKKIDSAEGRLDGIRVLKQDSWEALVAFICSANNNIPRITLMVNRLCESLGTPLPHPSLFTPSSVHFTPSTLPPSSSSSSSPPPTSPSLFSFPPPSSLTPPTTSDLLRQLGFGYRAPFINTTSLMLLEMAENAGVTPNEYLDGLAKKESLGQVREELMKFMGVGRKVADCVALFGLGRSEVVPVDTHVFQIAIRDYSFSASKTASLTPILHDKVSNLLSNLWGPQAGWAQQVLFFADLKPSSSSSLSSTPERKVAVKKEKVIVKAKWEMELEEFEKSPLEGRKRGRKVVKSYVELEDEDESVKVEERYPTPASLGEEEKVKKRKMTVVTEDTKVVKRTMKVAKKEVEIKVTESRVESVKVEEV